MLRLMIIEFPCGEAMLCYVAIPDGKPVPTFPGIA
jgi:hypothetical protein